MFKILKKNRRLMGGFLVGIVVVMGVLAQATSKQKEGYGRSVETEHRMEWLKPSESVSQALYAEYDGLEGVQLLIGFLEYSAKGSYELVNDETGELLAEGNFKAGVNQSILKISWATQENSQGKNYTLTLHASEKNKVPLALQQQAGSYEDWVTTLVYDRSGDGLSFWQEIVDRMSQYKPAWSKTPFLFIYWGGFLVGLIGLIAGLTKLNDQSTHK